ncbi:MAG TPA: methylthioribulose 1-phosphate dehydratase [Candidatus Acidoferrales bacterium]|nr:methylthioribulose 1-phosphate dehydratase [Candidatus Acidoferrales bacterium]
MQIDSLAAQELAAFGRFAAERGWVPATSGNFSRRLDERTALLTRSGADKGALIAPDDFLAVPIDGPVPPGVSAETPLHLERYRSDARIGAVAHVHSIAATVLSRLDAGRGEVLVEGWEMQKALAGFTTHESTVRIPVFANAQDTQALARRIEERLATCEVPGYLLAGHGLYAWGSNVSDARRHLEGLEFLLRCTLEERRIRS